MTNKLVPISHYRKKENKKKRKLTERTPIPEKIGKNITNLHDFMKLAKLKKSVVWNNKILLPACVVINWSLAIMITYINSKSFRYYNCNLEDYETTRNILE